MPNQTLGLIAGNGRFPILLAKTAKTQNYNVVAAAIKGDTSLLIRLVVDQLRWIKAGELKKLFEYFRAQGVKQVIMAGQVSPGNLFDQKFEPDQEFKKIFAALKDRKADTIFRAVAERLKEEGMELLDSTTLLSTLLAPKGTLTHRGPTIEELQDIEFGQEIAKTMGAIDVGQTVIVKEKAIVAIEAMEGTDQAILRGGKISRQGAVIVKVSKPKQDSRFDVPVIGPRTIRSMIKAKAACLAIEAGKTLILDREATVALANQAKICIVAA